MYGSWLLHIRPINMCKYGIIAIVKAFTDQTDGNNGPEMSQLIEVLMSGPE